jgi:hypothetical protein
MRSQINFKLIWQLADGPTTFYLAVSVLVTSNDPSPIALAKMACDRHIPVTGRHQRKFGLLREANLIRIDVTLVGGMEQ